MVTEIKGHALVQHYLTVLRNCETKAESFRHASEALTRILILEATGTLSLEAVEVETPLERTTGKRLCGEVVIVPILRAGISMLETALSLIPNAAVGFVGLERDEVTAEAFCYYAKLPEITHATTVIVLDPMLATGGSAIQTVSQLKAMGAQKLTMVSIISAPEGVQAFCAEHGDVPIITGVIDRELNAKKFICPGLGDFGDRLFKT